MRAGRILEPAVARYFEEDTGRKVWQPGNGFTIFHNEDFPFLAATPDRFQSVDGQEGEGNLQLKTASGFTKAEWEDGAIPLHYQVQVNIEMLCTGLSWGSISVLFDGRTHEFRDYQLLDSADADELLKRLEAFWKRVLDGRPPDADYRDLDAVKALYPQSDPEKVVELSAEKALRMEALWAQKESCEDEIKESERRKKDAEAKLRMEFGDNEELHSPDGTVYRLPTTTVKRPEKTTPASEYSFRKLSRRLP